ncbi:MAG: hypothetical protein CVU12_08815 [Bacteroidetes bacterium HGW-Bacteroidetes-7]|jgi:hypothetical protein|nr:MAG: hypothetical protein CVU12_08815 [Bacteroidetes bacterium HGW-Bacteroidetes-7]
MKKFFAVLILGLMCIVVCQTSLKAQISLIRVAITVVDTVNVGIPGVQIKFVVGLGGGETDLDGKYVLICMSNSTLRFSKVGLITQDVAVNNQNAITVVMKEDLLAYNNNTYKFNPILNFLYSCKYNKVLFYNKNI